MHGMFLIWIYNENTFQKCLTLQRHLSSSQEELFADDLFSHKFECFCIKIVFIHRCVHYQRDNTINIYRRKFNKNFAKREYKASLNILKQLAVEKEKKTTLFFENNEKIINERAVYFLKHKYLILEMNLTIYSKCMFV